MYTMWALSTVYNAYSPTPWMKKTLTALEDFWCFPIVTQIYWCLFIVTQNVTKEQARNIKRSCIKIKGHNIIIIIKKELYSQDPPPQKKKNQCWFLQNNTMCSAFYKMCYCITIQYTKSRTVSWLITKLMLHF